MKNWAGFKMKCYNWIPVIGIFINPENIHPGYLGVYNGIILLTLLLLIL